MLTIKTWLHALGRQLPAEECPVWPPDLFAVAGMLLKRSGAYLRVFDRAKRRADPDGITNVGGQWRMGLDAVRQPVTIDGLRSVIPSDVTAAWAILIKAKDTPITEISKLKSLTEALILAALVADQASAGIGVGEFSADDGSEPSAFLSLAGWMLTTMAGRSFCWDISADAICVLGKQHTPQRGATFRSLTHHLSLYPPSDIHPRWIGPLSNGEPKRDVLNLLLLPWPTSIQTDDFVLQAASHGDRPGNAGYFRFAPRRSPSPAKFAAAVRRAIATARQEAGHVDAVVFPELALTYPQYTAAERIAVRERTMLIGGVRKSSRGGRQDYNHCVFQPAGMLIEPAKSGRHSSALVEKLRLVQSKHHRWCLDREQVVNYQLASRLPVSRPCWESIELPERLLHFVTLNYMTWSVLICEDLARQDPAADLIRAVGPNLLIALLMDGPQLSGRWPSRYASVLAEDPGCSVLTLTSLGMVKRCRPILKVTGKRSEPSRVIALWRDVQAGEIEITLDPEDDACVLTLECTTREEYSADGRGDGQQTRYPVFAGYRSFRTGT